MIKIGIAGVRGLSTLAGLRLMEDVRIDAMCDLNEQALANAAERLGDVKQYRVFEDMLERDIDAVIIATPMQCHVPQAIAALEAGKHVMSEVTAGVTMDELFWLTECVEKYEKIYMYAENYIFTPQVQLVKEMVRSGLFGEPYYAEGSYLHNIRDLLSPGENGRLSWRNYWQCGTRGNFYPTHSVGPVMQWFEGDRITEISTFSPGVWNNLGVRQDSGTTTLCRTEKGKLIQIRTDCLSPRPHNMDRYVLQGTTGAFESAVYGKGRLEGDSDRVSLVSNKTEKGEMDWEPLMNYRDLLPDKYKNATPDQLNAGHGGGDFFIVEDFINAIRKNEQPELDVYKACEWTAVGLLSALSVTNGSRTIEVPRFRRGMPLEEKRIKL